MLVPRLKRLDNVTQQKLAKLQRWDPDCAEVVTWLLKHKDTDEFAQRVGIPAAVSVTIRDRKYTDAAESCFNANQLKVTGPSHPSQGWHVLSCVLQTFVTHSEEDYRTFNRIFNDTPEALGHKVRVTVWHRPQNPAQLLRPPLSVDEVNSKHTHLYMADRWRSSVRSASMAMPSIISSVRML